MHQILFRVPLVNLPLYGYGLMLFLAFACCLWLSVRIARREGIPTEKFPDLVMWLFLFGILGARATFVVRYWHQFADFWQVFHIMDGGLIFYGSLPGALIGYGIFYWRHLRQHHVSHWKMADVVAPCLALGLCLGRVGCLLNGCCYGNVACADCPRISFPLPSAPSGDMVKRGHQAPAGFLADGAATVAAVEPRSPAAEAGLAPGDVIVAIGPPHQQKEVHSGRELGGALAAWPRGENAVAIDVRAEGGSVRALPPFVPRGLGLHPTQIYESISMVLLLFLLLSYYPFKKRDGSVMVLFMLGYGLHRFLNEMLRTDTEIVALGLTFSQNISLILLAAAAVLAVAVWRRPPIVPGDSPLQSEIATAR